MTDYLRQSKLNISFIHEGIRALFAGTLYAIKSYIQKKSWTTICAHTFAVFEFMHNSFGLKLSVIDNKTYIKFIAFNPLLFCWICQLILPSPFVALLNARILPQLLDVGDVGLFEWGDRLEVDRPNDRRLLLQLFRAVSKLDPQRVHRPYHWLKFIFECVFIFCKFGDIFSLFALDFICDWAF